jgi:hypothetical protein
MNRDRMRKRRAEHGRRVLGAPRWFQRGNEIPSMGNKVEYQWPQWEQL